MAVRCGATCSHGPRLWAKGPRTPADHGVTVVAIELARTCPRCGTTRSAPMPIKRFYSGGGYPLAYHVWSCRCGSGALDAHGNRLPLWLYADIADEAQVGHLSPGLGRYVLPGEWPPPPRTVEELATWMAEWQLRGRPRPATRSVA